MDRFIWIVIEFIFNKTNHVPNLDGAVIYNKKELLFNFNFINVTMR